MRPGRKRKVEARRRQSPNERPAAEEIVPIEIAIRRRDILGEMKATGMLDCPLDVLKAQNQITAEQYQAGWRFHIDACYLYGLPFTKSPSIYNLIKVDKQAILMPEEDIHTQRIALRHENQRDRLKSEGLLDCIRKVAQFMKFPQSMNEVEQVKRGLELIR